MIDIGGYCVIFLYKKELYHVVIGVFLPVLLICNDVSYIPITVRASPSNVVDAYNAGLPIIATRLTIIYQGWRKRAFSTRSECQGIVQRTFATFFYG